jgi:putative effector of murein hydrolase
LLAQHTALVSSAISFKEMKLIPTRNKSKLPKSMSYPLGAKEISEALGACPRMALVEMYGLA